MPEITASLILSYLFAALAHRLKATAAHIALKKGCSIYPKRGTKAEEIASVVQGTLNDFMVRVASMLKI